MNYYYISGSSKGLGKAISELLLEDENQAVTGIARSASIEHPRYTHLLLDLSDPAAVKDMNFEPHPDASKIVLIN